VGRSPLSMMTGNLRNRRIQDFSAIAMIAMDSLRSKNRDSFLNNLSNFGGVLKSSSKKEASESVRGGKIFRVLIANDDNF